MKMMDYNGGDCRWVCVAHTSDDDASTAGWGVYGSDVSV